MRLVASSEKLGRLRSSRASVLIPYPEAKDQNARRGPPNRCCTFGRGSPQMALLPCASPAVLEPRPLPAQQEYHSENRYIGFYKCIRCALMIVSRTKATL